MLDAEKRLDVVQATAEQADKKVDQHIAECVLWRNQTTKSLASLEKQIDKLDGRLWAIAGGVLVVLLIEAAKALAT